MIVEFPIPACVAFGFKRDRMRAARREALDACGSFSTSSFTALQGNVRIKVKGTETPIRLMTCIFRVTCDVTPRRERALGTFVHVATGSPEQEEA
jgi:hypothetical protein